MAPLNLRDRVPIGSITTRNRICVPPMVRYRLAGPDGIVTDGHVAHYRRMAEGGAGLIIQEATCITRDGRLSGDQLGIWSDDHIPGLRRIVEAVHGEGCPIFVQLHHAGIQTFGPDHPCPSAYLLHTPSGDRQGRPLTLEEIASIRGAFIEGGRRAYEAGYDGVELHGCHSYLLCQFLNRNVNRRTDRYGQEPMTLIREIYKGIREVTSPEFVIGIRLGGFEPTLADGIAHARALEAMGIEFLDISYGFTGEMDLNAPGNPNFSAAVRAAAAIKAQVSIPVFAVNGIRTPRDGSAILSETGVDLVDVGRSILVDPEWPSKALNGRAPGRCLGCKDCQWRIDPEKCPGRRLLRQTI